MQEKNQQLRRTRDEILRSPGRKNQSKAPRNREIILNNSCPVLTKDAKNERRDNHSSQKDKITPR
jgi:hypothetical protein